METREKLGYHVLTPERSYISAILHQHLSGELGSQSPIAEANMQGQS